MDPDHLVVRTTFGLLVTDRGGPPWRWVCNAAFGARDVEDPPIAIAPDGSLLVATADGLMRAERDGCAWTSPSESLRRFVIDVVADPADPRVLYALTSDGGDRPNLLFRSDDGGSSWVPTSAPIEPILFETVRIAPSRRERIYLSGAYPSTSTEPRRAFVFRSDDGGASWTRIPFEPLRDGRNVLLLAVDPTNPDRLFAEVPGDRDDRLVRSDDAGASWTEVLVMPDVRGLVWSDDGRNVWTGGVAGGGLWRSSDGGVSFEAVDKFLEVGCLARRGTELWVCANNYVDGYAAGRSFDGGRTIVPVLVFDDIEGIVPCDASSGTARECTPRLPDLIFDLGLSLDAGVPVDAADAGGPPWLDGGRSGRRSGRTAVARRPAGGGGLRCAADLGPGDGAWAFFVVGSVAWLVRHGGSRGRRARGSCAIFSRVAFAAAAVRDASLHECGACNGRAPASWSRRRGRAAATGSRLPDWHRSEVNR